MKRSLKNLSILCLGLMVGFFLGRGIIFGIQKTYTVLADSVKNINFNFSFGENGIGGPELSASVFASEKNNKEYISDHQKKYRISSKAPVPNVDSNSYLVGDLETGEIILVKNQDTPYPIASISKLMTSVVADESFGLSKEVKITKEALDTYGKQGRLSEGEIYKVSEILYPLLLESSNDATEAVAESFGRDQFIQEMNKKSREIEMFNTNFYDPSGLSQKNISTVGDLFKLSQYINNYRDYIFSITALKTYKIGKKTWYNNSKFRNDQNYFGGKNGYTDEAGNTQVVIFEMKFNSEDSPRKIAFIVLNTSDVKNNIYGLKKYVEKYVTYE